jgi:hypothetical protein
MKKVIIAICLVSVLLFAWVVPVSALDYPYGNQWATYIPYNFNNNGYTGGFSYILVAGQTNDVGYVIVYDTPGTTENPGYLYIQYVLVDGWRLLKTQLAVTSGATENNALIQVPHNNPGNIIPGQFQQLSGTSGSLVFGAEDSYSSGTNTTESVLYKISKNVFSPYSTVYIFAHGNVEMTNGTNGNTAWGDDDPPPGQLPELPAVALLGLGLAGIGTIIFVKRRSRPVSAR